MWGRHIPEPGDILSSPFPAEDNLRPSTLNHRLTLTTRVTRTPSQPHRSFEEAKGVGRAVIFEGQHLPKICNFFNKVM